MHTNFVWSRQHSKILQKISLLGCMKSIVSGRLTILNLEFSFLILLVRVFISRIVQKISRENIQDVVSTPRIHMMLSQNMSTSSESGISIRRPRSLSRVMDSPMISSNEWPIDSMELWGHSQMDGEQSFQIIRSELSRKRKKLTDHLVLCLSSSSPMLSGGLIEMLGYHVWNFLIIPIKRWGHSIESSFSKKHLACRGWRSKK